MPLVIFLRKGDHPAELALGGDCCQYLAFRYLACHLYDLNWQDWRDSDNLIARLNLPDMRYRRRERVAVYAWAIRGLLELEPDPEKRAKYLDFVDIYTTRTDAERDEYQRDYPEENATMVSFQTRFEQIGEERGRQLGNAEMLLNQMHAKFGPLPDPIRQRIEQAEPDTLLHWSIRILTEDSIEAVLR